MMKFSDSKLFSDRVWLTFSVTFTIGLIYGIFVYPYWNETVEFGQIIAQKIHVDTTRGWYRVVVDGFSSQSTLQALLLKTGLSEWTLSALSSGLVTALAFSSVGLTALLVTESALVSIFCSILLTHYTFHFSHFYDVLYPNSFYVFGHVGHVSALLALVFLAHKKFKSSMLTLGLLFGVHLPWAVGATLGVTTYFIYKKHRPDIKQIVYLLFGLLISASLYMSYKAMAPLPPPDLPWEPSKPVVQAVDTSAENMQSTKIEKRKTFEAHIHHLGEYKMPAYGILSYFSYDILFITFGTIIYIRRKDLLFENFRDFFVMALILSFVGITYKIVEGFDPDFKWSLTINEHLPDAIKRAIINRWLNIDTLASPVLIFSFLVTSALTGNLLNLCVLIYLIYLFCISNRFALFFDRGDTYLDLNHFTQILVLGFAFLITILFSKSNFRAKWSSRAASFAIILFIIGNFAVWGFRAVRFAPVSGKDEYTPLTDQMAGKTGAILLGQYVHGKDGRLNVQTRTGRPFIVPNMYAIPSLKAGEQLELFCYDDLYMTYTQFTNKTKKCFEEYSPEFWSHIRSVTGATQLLVIDDWTIKLPKVTSAAGVALYDLPVVTSN